MVHIAQHSGSSSCYTSSESTILQQKRRRRSAEDFAATTATSRASARERIPTFAPELVAAQNSATTIEGGSNMAKYGKKAGQKVKRAMHERKKGTLKSGRSGKKVKSRKQAIAIGLSEARKAGAKVPRKRSSKK
jgi:hypothetical protein